MPELQFLVARVLGLPRTQVKGLVQNQRKKWNFNNKWMLNYLVISTKTLVMKRLMSLQNKVLKL